MLKRKFKTIISLTLLMFMSIGLTISTLHSHHHLEWNHPTDFVDTGTCLSVDTTNCPITGYIFETEILSASHSGDIFFSVEEIITEKNIQINDGSIVVNLGRSPPVLG